MRVLIADEFSKRHLDTLRGLGVTVEYKPDVKADELPALTANAAPSLAAVARPWSRSINPPISNSNSPAPLRSARSRLWTAAVMGKG